MTGPRKVSAKKVVLSLALIFCACCALAALAPIEYMENIIRGPQRMRVDDLEREGGDD